MATVQPQAEPWRGDTLLAAILNAPTLGTAQLQASDTLASKLGEDFDKRVAAVAMDSTAPPLIRSNAILLLSDRRVRNFDAYYEALHASDDRVRASAVFGLRPFMGTWRSAVGLAKTALDDPSTLVQTKALEVLGDTDPDVLRSYARKAIDTTLRKIALDLVQVAEDRGSPLIPRDSTGMLERVTPSGHTLRFRPTQQWPKWNAAAGELWLAAPGSHPVLISSGVEVVSNVLPAFVSTDGLHLVYEADRQVRVREIASAKERVLGAGIAPRLLHFTDSFIFLRQKEVQHTPEGSSLRYDVVRDWFAEPKPAVIGQITTEAKNQVHGNYSPARWLRVRETDGSFFLAGDRISFRLPNPFAGK